MSSGKPGRRPLVFGLRLGLWYATLFVAGALVIVCLTYYLTASSLAQRDREVIQSRIGAYASVYARGGLRALTDTVSAEQATAPERLFVRVIDQGSEALVVGMAGRWDPATLETGSIRLIDGTIIQVGKSTEARQDVLARVRATLGLVALSVIVVAFAGGWLAMETAVKPIRRLTEAFGHIVDTGRTDERVPVPENDDAIGELTRLFNQMVDKIDRLVGAMRGALDNVAHDLRTPLARLRGTAEMALAGDPDLERCREALADCVEETDRVLVMLNTLMDISEAESGAMPLRREVVALSDVAARAVDLYRDVADAKDLGLSVELAPDVFVSCDRVRLEQVAGNLLDNAVKYTPGGGRVTVRVAREGDRALLRVSDTGPGIPADELPRIWERLFRGDRSRAERGLGLGLSFVKAIVEAHGGAVRAESRPGAGSTFDVSLPLASAPAPNLSRL